MLASGRNIIKLSYSETISYHTLEEDGEWRFETLNHLLEDRELKVLGDKYA